jgi:hypothetical protein
MQYGFKNNLKDKYMANFQVVIEGQGAVSTAKELKEVLAEIGVSVNLEIPEQETSRDLGTIEAAILTFVMTVAAEVTADQIKEKIRKHQESQPKNQIEQVESQNQSEKSVLFIAPDGSRERKNLSPDKEQNISEILEEIRKMLEEDEDF